MFEGIINASLHTSGYQFTLQAYRCPTSVLHVSTGQAVCVSVRACCFSSQACKTFVCNNDWYLKMKNLPCTSTNCWWNYVPILVFLFEGEVLSGILCFQSAKKKCCTHLINFKFIATFI